MSCRTEKFLPLLFQSPTSSHAFSLEINLQFEVFISLYIETKRIIPVIAKIRISGDWTTVMRARLLWGVNCASARGTNKRISSENLNIPRKSKASHRFFFFCERGDNGWVSHFSLNIKSTNKMRKVTRRFKCCSRSRDIFHFDCTSFCRLICVFIIFFNFYEWTRISISRVIFYRWKPKMNVREWWIEVSWAIVQVRNLLDRKPEIFAVQFCQDSMESRTLAKTRAQRCHTTHTSLA